jgi:hypothetical protein
MSDTTIYEAVVFGTTDEADLVSTPLRGPEVA